MCLWWNDCDIKLTGWKLAWSRISHNFDNWGVIEHLTSENSQDSQKTKVFNLTSPHSLKKGFQISDHSRHIPGQPHAFLHISSIVCRLQSETPLTFCAAQITFLLVILQYEVSLPLYVEWPVDTVLLLSGVWLDSRLTLIFKWFVPLRCIHNNGHSQQDTGCWTQATPACVVGGRHESSLDTTQTKTSQDSDWQKKRQKLILCINNIISIINCSVSQAMKQKCYQVLSCLFTVGMSGLIWINAYHC